MFDLNLKSINIGDKDTVNIKMKKKNSVVKSKEMKEISFGLQRTVLMRSIWKSLMSETRKEATAGSEVRQRSCAIRTEDPD